MSHSTYTPKCCPRCNEPLQRTRRRPIDRLISMFRTVHRYRCTNAMCGWEGNIRVQRKAY